MDNRSTTAKDRWAIARQVSEILGCRVSVAWKVLNKLKQDELLDAILQGIDDAIEVGREIVNEQPKAPTPMWQRISDVKIMLWSFNKIGDMERIRVAFKKCMGITEDEA